VGDVILRWTLIAGLGAALVALGWVRGADHVQARWDAATSQEVQRTAAIRQRQAEATVKVVTEYVDRIKVVHETGQTIVKEVPIYVPIQADAACMVNRGFVRLHDAAAHNLLPGSAGDADGAASGIALSAVVETVVDNYQRCNENAEKLKALQNWIRTIR